MSVAVGIDLGTTYSAIAVLDDRGRPTILPNSDGELLTPSAVCVGDRDEVVIGQAALDAAVESPGSVATLIKRRMGYPDYGRPVAGRTFRPETLAALILKKLVADVRPRIGPVERAVIGVPAYFDDTRRKATQDAGRIAGLEVLDLIDEPCAAALAYAMPEGRPVGDRDEETVLVYDLGGGTFDVSIVRLGRRYFQTLAIEGDVRLGGQDWDDRIAARAAAAFLGLYGTDPRGDAKSAALLQAAAERTKRALSKLPQATLTCSHAGHVVSLTLTRDEFEESTRDLWTRTRLTALQVVRAAGLSWSDIDRVLLVGGATHMPMAARLLRELSGREPDSGLAVSHVVACGAALHAGIVSARGGGAEEEPLADVVEIHVTAHGLGVAVKHRGERIHDVLIRKNTQLPASGARVYRTAKAGQRRVRVRVLQGDARQAGACIPLGECWIEDLPPNLPAGSPIEVRCRCEANGLVKVSATDRTTGRAVRAELRRDGGLGEDEIRREAEWVRSRRLL